MLNVATLKVWALYRRRRPWWRPSTAWWGWSSSGTSPSLWWKPSCPDGSKASSTTFILWTSPWTTRTLSPVRRWWGFCGKGWSSIMISTRLSFRGWISKRGASDCDKHCVVINCMYCVISFSQSSINTMIIPEGGSYWFGRLCSSTWWNRTIHVTQNVSTRQRPNEWKT